MLPVSGNKCIGGETFRWAAVKPISLVGGDGSYSLGGLEWMKDLLPADQKLISKLANVTQG